MSLVTLGSTDALAYIPLENNTAKIIRSNVVLGLKFNFHLII